MINQLQATNKHTNNVTGELQKQGTALNKLWSETAKTAVKLKPLAEGAKREIGLLATASVGKSDQVRSITTQILVDAIYQMVEAKEELRKEIKQIQEAPPERIERHRRKAKNGFPKVDTQMSKITSYYCG